MQPFSRRCRASRDAVGCHKSISGLHSCEKSRDSGKLMKKSLRSLLQMRQCRRAFFSQAAQHENFASKNTYTKTSKSIVAKKKKNIASKKRRKLIYEKLTKTHNIKLKHHVFSQTSIDKIFHRIYDLTSQGHPRETR